MRRRDLLVACGVAMILSPLRGQGQQASTPVVGHLSSPVIAPELVAAFRQGLSELGDVEGQNVVIEYRSAEGQYDRLPDLVADFVQRRVSVIVTTGGAVTALAAQSRTSIIPIVFACGDDPVEIGLVAALNRPGGNATGISFFTLRLEVKRLELLRELMPEVMAFGMLVNPKNPNSGRNIQDVRAALESAQQRLYVAEASTDAAIGAAFTTLVEQGVGALMVATDPFLYGRRNQVVGLAARNGLPAIYEWRDYVAEGGLMSYGASLVDAQRQLGVYTGRILRGDKPADLPVMQPTKFEFVINLKTAKALGLTVTPLLLARANEVIE
jgi:ABC-type uncharacterized transport system substrate-binding protein